MVTTTAQFALRSLQSLFALLAIIFTWGGYVKNDDGQLGGLSPEFSILMNYTALLTGLYYVLPVKVYKWTTVAPSTLFQRLTDGALVVLLLLSGILLWASSGVKDCSEKNDEYEAYAGLQLFRCGNLTMGVIFTFITFALFLGSLVWGFFGNNSTGQAEVGASYAEVTTPSAARAEAYSAADSRHPVLAIARRGSRFIQFVLSLIIFISTVAGYKHYFTGRFMSPVAMFMVLVSWSCVLYTLFHLVVVDILKKSHRPSVSVERVVDLFLSALLLLFAILLAASHQVDHCDTINAKYEADAGSLGGTSVYRCGSLTRAYVLAFIDCIFFLATFALSFGGSCDSEPVLHHVDVEPGQQ
ncbi:uncharacterized protein PITG_13660 [Phytophthora infestans T30-4]|uniref:Uncharacterized protein n=1 Tax=Phytophthora infestans (strain T30-4) TaxID=403677 RepID=D0NMH7_PHYIT|nr:uncharacterized protein PITG_13660 [Phytophthora infestans T30-4]EEY60898.1 conserved hypothetical protein [Phytophthora infestans T30-4]KAI9980031.1 hypothetical protein PInf_026911 [Phytophthora infestans]|eukprot:XP_002899844.1 conserved hypothetical protein [Phytophthora infestans T30-4]